ncbi:MAG: transcriptional regulator, MarR family [Armatimonadetes bacterium]|jgi:MarR family 2-MHQ and catechol resistance regulon transcriptional repressor|nr:transcriptional regulator, MarR family [Armatimonadota bacterium]
MTTEQLLKDNPPYAALWYLARAYHSLVNRLNPFLEARGITGAQFGVLRCLSDAGAEGLMLSELSRNLMVTCGNTTGVVDRLEHAGYLLRERQADDRRVVVARLTAEGAALYQELMPAYQELVRSMLSGLTVADQEALARFCRELHISLETFRDLVPGGASEESGAERGGR